MLLVAEPLVIGAWRVLPQGASPTHAAVTSDGPHTLSLISLHCRKISEWQMCQGCKPCLWLDALGRLVQLLQPRQCNRSSFDAEVGGTTLSLWQQRPNSSRHENHTWTIDGIVQLTRRRACSAHAGPATGDNPLWLGCRGRSHGPCIGAQWVLS